MTTDEFARAAFPLLHEGTVLLRAHAGEEPAIERFVATVDKVREQYRAAKEAPAPAPDGAPPGFRIVGRSGPGVPRVNGQWAVSTLPGEGRLPFEIKPNVRPFGRDWRRGDYALLKPVPAPAPGPTAPPIGCCADCAGLLERAAEMLADVQGEPDGWQDWEADMRKHVGYVPTEQHWCLRGCTFPGCPRSKPEPPAPPAGVPVCRSLAPNGGDMCGRDAGHAGWCHNGAGTSWRRYEAPLNPPPSDPVTVATGGDDAQIYPCWECGVMRSKRDGGTVFTVCDACWDKNPPTDVKIDRNPAAWIPEATAALALRSCKCGHAAADHVNGFGHLRDCGAEKESGFCGCAQYREADAAVAARSVPSGPVHPATGTTCTRCGQVIQSVLPASPPVETVDWWRHKRCPEVPPGPVRDSVDALRYAVQGVPPGPAPAKRTIEAAHVANAEFHADETAARAEVEQLKARAAEAEQEARDADEAATYSRGQMLEMRKLAGQRKPGGEHEAETKAGDVATVHQPSGTGGGEVAGVDEGEARCGSGHIWEPRYQIRSNDPMHRPTTCWRCARCLSTDQTYDDADRMQVLPPIGECIEHAAALGLATARIRELEEMLGFDTPWPVTSVLERLLAAVEHGLKAHDCDHHGWEVDQGAVEAARAIVARIEKATKGTT